MADTDKLISDGINRLNERKRRLFAVACVRQVWDLVVDEQSRRSVEVAELYADGLATEAQLSEAQTVARTSELAAARAAAWAAARAAADAVARVAASDAAFDAADAAAFDAADAARAAARDVAWATARDARAAAWNVALNEARAGQLALLRKEFLPVEGIDPTWLAWNGGTVAKIATAIYQDKRFQDTPVLADALEDAGCTVVSVLEHLRNLDHVRGCWALDLLLRKG